MVEMVLVISYIIRCSGIWEHCVKGRNLQTALAFQVNFLLTVMIFTFDSMGKKLHLKGFNIS